MRKHIIEYVDWQDLQEEICKEMGIDEKYFRDYHKIVGGDYKDLWHKWMHYFQEVRNDTIVRFDLGERIESKLDWLKEEDEEWLTPFVEAVYKVCDDNEFTHIRYSW